MNTEKLREYFPHKVIKRKVRHEAVKRVRKDLILNSKCEEDISEADLEYLLADAESSVWSDIRQTSLIGVLAMLGMSFF